MWRLTTSLLVHDVGQLNLPVVSIFIPPPPPPFRVILPPYVPAENASGIFENV